MAEHTRFHYKTLDDLRRDIARLQVDIPVDDDLEVLSSPVTFGKHTAPNRLAVHPMEGCDGEADGRPGPLTIRRYERFVGGGAGLLWVEACAVAPEGRANPRQLWMTRENLGDYVALVRRMRQVAAERYGAEFRPVLVLQLTHSGRYSKPEGKPAPMVARRSPLDATSHVTDDMAVVSDSYLDDLQGAYLEAAALAQEAGFDAVDVKACHGYLLSELLASFSRENSRYGGSYENRTRFITEVVARIRQALPELDVTTRLNVFDPLEYPYGWGVSRLEGLQPDLTEPLQLVGQLQALGMQGINITIGNPYYQPHYNRPFDRPVVGGYMPPEHPLESFHRFLHVTRQVQQAYPALNVIGSGYSWLRQFFPHVATAAIEQGWITMVGVGREAFAYPDFADDLLRHGALEPGKCCIACSGCTQLMRDGMPSGCMVRDAEVYGPIYKEGRAKRS